MAVLEFRRLSSFRRNERLLDNISFDVEKGQLSLCLSDDAKVRNELALIMAGLCRPGEGSALIGTRDAWRVEKVTQRSVGFVIPGIRYDGDFTIRETIERQRRLRHLPRRDADPRVKFDYLKLWDIDPEQKIGELDTETFALFQLLLAYEHSPAIFILADLCRRASEDHIQHIADFITERISEGTTVLLLESFWHEALPFPDLVQIIHQGSLLLDAETFDAGELLPAKPGLDLEARDSLPDDFYERCVRYQTATARESMQYLPGEGTRRSRTETDRKDNPLEEKLKQSGGKLKLK